MILTPQQDMVIKNINSWLNDYYNLHIIKKLYVLKGYAGTGKTTIVKYIDDKYLYRTICAAYTGKAAKVLQSKIGLPAYTIHSLIYKPMDDKSKKDGVRWVLNTESPILDSKLVIIDEGSMVGKKILDDLMSFDVPILLIGDPGQLETINDDNIFNKLQPDSTLLEIHRQAKENPIIRLSMMARQGKEIPYQSYGNHVKKIKKTPETYKKYLYSADMVLVGRNITRNLINKAFRDKLQFKNRFPLKKDRIICLKNNQNYNVLNGHEGIVNKDAIYDPNTGLITLSCILDDFVLSDVKSFACYFLPNCEETLKTYDRKYIHAYLHFDYAYAITVHKSQGSQYNNVCIIDEFNWGDSDTRKRMLYTAITRAEEKLIILQ